MASKPPPVLEVIGAKQLRASLRRAGDDLEDMKATHATIGQLVAQAAQARVPRRTGRLAATIRPSGTKTQAIVRAGFQSVPYAGPIHWGWPARGIRAQPYLTDAAKDTEPAWLEIYTRDVQGICDDVEGAPGYG